MNSTASNQQWDGSPSAPDPALGHTGPVFERFFEDSIDAVWLFDPQTGVFEDCNRAAVELIGAANKEQVLRMRPEDLSPPFQPDGSTSAAKSAEIIALIQKQKTHRFEWLMRRQDGRDVPLEVSATAVLMDGKRIHVIISRDITERKKAERELRELTLALERRVTERTDALSTSEARFRALVENAPEAIVVFDGATGRFLFGNEHTCRLYGVTAEKLAELTPADVSPEFQPDGRRSSESAREKMDAALAGGMPVFEWTHKQQPTGRLIPTEVRLLRLPAEGQNLIRASISDNTERKRAEQALRDSEEKFRALFEGSSQGVILQDEGRFLEANPAAVRIMRRKSVEDLLGRNPREMSPPFQPNGESSEAMARKHIEDCMTQGHTRFEWMSCDPDGGEIPLEVALTRIQWSGRQVIQAFVTDIAERKRAEAELRASEARLRESEARFSVAFQASPVSIVIMRMDDGGCVLANESFLEWIGCSHEEIIGHNSLALGIWADPAEREALWQELRRTRSVRERECRMRNRHGKSFIMLLSADVIEMDRVPHVLAVGLDITQRKRAEEELRASEARLRESEARFTVAFEASPMFINILRMSDGKYVWANDAFVNRLGYSRDEVLGRPSTEFGMWADPAERDAAWETMRTAGSIRQREVRWRDRHNAPFTILLSAEIIQFNGEPHILSLALDITLRKRAEEELRKTLEREKELSQLKSNFVSMVSHEFRTPLGIIQSSAELLRDFHQKMEPAERTEQLESITRNTRRMAGMMEEILVLSRLDAGKLECQPAPLNLDAFCRRVVDEVVSATHHQGGIELAVTPALPEANADERLLGHIFTNLLSNAVKYSESGAPVQFTIAREGAAAVCVIRDQGIGIPDEDRTRLFTAFHRGVNVGNRSGTGLGLVLVKRCTDLHHGELHIQSALGKGTTVTVRIPVFQANL